MRLIDTKTLKIHGLLGEDVPAYAIVSHRWGTEEVAYQDWLYAFKQSLPRWGWVYLEDEAERIRFRLGFVKIRNACRHAAENGYCWLWVNTNCIDKGNPAEHSEAINSMYRWYQNSAICYAFLEDVPDSMCETQYKRSQWFTRGWTLQELIAPRELRFTSQSWTKMG